jgi:hypothetical protein
LRQSEEDVKLGKERERKQADTTMKRKRLQARVLRDTRRESKVRLSDTKGCAIKADGMVSEKTESVRASVIREL